jgi:hypothetical protein
MTVSEEGVLVRELTKAAISYGWASTLFQMQQLINVLSTNPQTGDNRATEGFNALAAVTADQLGPTMQATYRIGDGLQRGMFDMMFGGFGALMPGSGSGCLGDGQSASAWDAGRSGGELPVSGPSWRDLAGQAAERPEHAPAGSGAGWGPMP